MASDTWKVLSDTLEDVAQFLPTPADLAVGLVAKLARRTYDVVEAQELSKKNQQLIQQLLERALIVSRMIEKYVLESRPRDKDFTTYVSSFRATMVDVLGFVEKFVQQGWIDRFWNGSEVKSQLEDLWRRLDTHAADYRGFLLTNIASRGPSERIEHPQLREFWRQSMKNPLEAKWVHFWDQLLYDFPGVRHFLSGPLAPYHKVKLQARALPKDAKRNAKFVGPWEINNLFQSPSSSVEETISSVLADYDGAAVFTKAHRTSNKISIEASTSVAQCWTGYWIRGSYKGVMTAELLVAANDKIYGGGSDEIGDFTCAGECRGSKVRFVKQYIGLHQVEYDGAISTTTINGIWTKDRGSSTRGAFKLKKQSCKFVPNEEEARVVQLGAMQRWTGYYNDKGQRGRIDADILFTETNKIYGSGVDTVGYFTLLGRFHKGSHSILVNIAKQYEGVCYKGANIVYYMGAVSHSLSAVQEDLKVVMEGSWGLTNHLDQGTFYLQPQGNNTLLHLGHT